MRCAAAHTEAVDPAAAAQEVCEALGTPGFDLGVVFATPHHNEHLGELVKRLREEAGIETLIGCSAEGVIAGAHEYENQPGVALFAAQLDTPVTAQIAGFLVSPGEDDEEPTGAVVGWPEAPPEDPRATTIILADPFTFPVHMVLPSLHADRPDGLVVGGMASGTRGPGQARLIVDDVISASGSAVCVVPGSVDIRPVVSQGCRPIGTPFVVTKVDGNVLIELAGRPALERALEVVNGMPLPERELARRALHVGIVVDENRDTWQRGDFLIRNLVGADPESGTIAIGDEVVVGQTVQFHVRDAASAQADLEGRAGDVVPPAGALLFCCNGRGSHMFERPDADAGTLSSAWGGVPLAGFFASGEIGPVGGTPFLHGFTASIAAFYGQT